MTIEARKYQLIEEIMQLSDEQVLRKFEEILKEYHDSMESLRHLIKSTREKTDIDQLIKEQGFKGIDKAKMDKLVAEIAIEEPIEDLIEMI
jgi:uncharacterized protein YjgD (DUF1641 family)